MCYLLQVSRLNALASTLVISVLRVVKHIRSERVEPIPPPTESEASKSSAGRSEGSQAWRQLSTKLLGRLDAADTHEPELTLPSPSSPPTNKHS